MTGTVSLIGLKYPQILNWLYDITVVVRIVVVQTNLGRAWAPSLLTRRMQRNPASTGWQQTTWGYYNDYAATYRKTYGHHCTSYDQNTWVQTTCDLGHQHSDHAAPTKGRTIFNLSWEAGWPLGSSPFWIGRATQFVGHLPTKHSLHCNHSSSPSSARVQSFGPSNHWEQLVLIWTRPGWTRKLLVWKCEFRD